MKKIRQQITTKFDDKNEKGWYFTKGNYETNLMLRKNGVVSIIHSLGHEINLKLTLN